MSLIDLGTAKQYLNVIHDFEDLTLQLLLDAAEDEASQFIGQPIDRIFVSESETNIPPSLLLAVLMLTQAAYQSSPEDSAKLRKGAEIKLTPYRIGWGI
ncbi:head-tail connector protein [Gimesia sp.]|uniref:head-tail connector protein n=1 Tax=Gimesia sp. TaxID=2024833 RepID=UPI003A8D73FF